MPRILAAIALLSIATPALAQQRPCGPMDQLRAHLAQEFGEAEVRQGVSAPGWMMRLFMAPDGRTWTIVGEKPGTGAGCILDSGTELEEPPVVEPEDQGA